jgi:hypothetical protein
MSKEDKNIVPPAPPVPPSSVDTEIAATKARIAELKKEQELAALKREAESLSNAPTAADVAPENEARSSGIVTGIEDKLVDPEIAAAYEQHKSKTPVSDKKEPLAAQIVQYMVIFREEKIDFTYSDKRAYVRHAATGALFLRTKSGDKGYEVVTDKGRQTLQTALMDECDLRTLSHVLTQMSIALATAPRLPEGAEESNSHAAFRASVNKMLKNAKTKEELGAALLKMLG